MEQADAGQPYQTFSVIKNFFLFKARGEHFVPCIVGATVAIMTVAVYPVGGQSLILPGRPSPIVLRGWDTEDTTIVE
jgi:hypothetical protein